MGSMHASHGGHWGLAIAWGGQHAKRTAWQSNEIILAGGYHAKAILIRLVQCMKCSWGAGAITESSAPPPLWPLFFAFAIIIFHLSSRSCRTSAFR